MNARWFFAGMFFAVSLLAEEAALPAPEPKRITLNGQTFELANSTNGENIATEGICPERREAGDLGRKLVTVQRITLAKPSSPR